MKRIREVIVVEGRYDKNTISQVVDAAVVTLGGFAVFNDREKLSFLRRLAEERGLIVLTDSDGAGFVIRNYLKGALPRDRVKQALIFSLRTCTIILTAAAVVGFLFSAPIIAFFRDDAQVVEIGALAFRFQCLTLPLSAVLTFANMLFQALGKSFRATVLAICRQGLYIPLVFLLSWRFQLTGLEVTQAVADLLGFLVSAAIMLHYFLWEFGKESAPAEK